MSMLMNILMLGVMGLTAREVTHEAARVEARPVTVAVAESEGDSVAEANEDSPLRTLWSGPRGESLPDRIGRYYCWVLLVIIVFFEPFVRLGARVAKRGKGRQIIMAGLWFVIVNGAFLLLAGAVGGVAAAIDQAYIAGAMMFVSFVLGSFMCRHGLRAARRIRALYAQYEIRKMAAMDVE
ncbi:hypothetical protein LCGC14_0017490 [marine sediment metagenome]|uniref:Uncharacterized protein n=1 Tax=marine sediment metagenome TaxID=412755 RepID=A0A0F9W1X4_9ZZZZ|nr:hypothetical protein [Phycisphaerae bacterium]HDZ42453.1 hypothetical protein [Phycisphaerae bacterium]